MMSRSSACTLKLRTCGRGPDGLEGSQRARGEKASNPQDVFKSQLCSIEFNVFIPTCNTAASGNDRPVESHKDVSKDRLYLDTAGDKSKRGRTGC